MKAAIRTGYGPPGILKVNEIDMPVPRKNEVLIRVHAATVNRTDCGILLGNPFIIRFFTGLLKPSMPVTGTDFAGTVQETGSEVRSFKVGDRVWGFNDNGSGSHAEFLTFPESSGISTIPEGLSFELAAASAEGAHYAFNFINKIKLKPGQKVLVNGASGAIGSAAVQFLNYFDAEVTAVCDTANLEMVKSLGVDRVVDYTATDFTRDEQQYHYVLDAVGKSSFGKCKPLLLPGGIYISSELGPGMENLYLPLISAVKGGKKVIFPLPLNIRRSLHFIRDLIEKGKFRPVIDRHYPLEKIAEAFEYVASGRKSGNVVIRMDNQHE